MRKDNDIQSIINEIDFRIASLRQVAARLADEIESNEEKHASWCACCQCRGVNKNSKPLKVPSNSSHKTTSCKYWVDGFNGKLKEMYDLTPPNLELTFYGGKLIKAEVL
jgi:hypothetical protein